MSEDPRAALAELAALRTPQVLVGTVSTLINLAYLRLGAVPEAREAADLGEARVAIDAIAALAPVVTRIAPPQLGSELRETLARLQLAYAELAEGPGSVDPASGGAPAPPSPPPPPQAPRPRIWTPRGEV